MQKLRKKSEAVIYQSHSGAIKLREDVKNETIWATQTQIAKTFNVSVPTINEHLKNIYKTKELSKNSTIKKFLIVQKEGKREIKRKINHYNLDIILSIGYRVNSKQATNFRIWATKTLKDHILKGYTINRNRIKLNYNSFMKTVVSIQNLLPENITIDPKTILELIKEFASTWMSLGAYDKEILKIKGFTKKRIQLTGKELLSIISTLKNELLKKNEASELFAIEKQKGSIEGIIGNIMQTFDGRQLYETTEEKAAHLLYFMIKNHPFIDGNKRSGAFAFIWFLHKTKIKGFRNINPTSLTALTLLIAESDPKKKNQMVAIIIQLLN